MKTQLILLALASLVLILQNPRLGYSMALVGVPEDLKPGKALGELFSKTAKLFFEGKEAIETAIKSATEGINGKIKELTDALDTRLKTAEEQIKDKGKEDPELKNEIKNLAQKHEEFVKQVDQKMADLKTVSNQPKQPETFAQEVKAALEAKKEGKPSIAERIKQIAIDKSFKEKSIEFSVKAVADMSITANTPAGVTFIGYDRRPGITVRPLFDEHIRPWFRQTTTEKPSISYLRETTSEGGPDITAEAATKPEMDFDFDEQLAKVVKIAGYFRLSEEMIDDIPYLLDYLSTRGLESLRNVEDYQLLHGTGSSGQLAGLDSVATAFAAGTGFVVGTPNEFDVLVAAKRQLRNKFMRATAVFVHPDNYALMRLQKATTKEPLFPYLQDMGTITVDGTPIVQNTRVAVGDFYAIDTTQMEIVDRMDARIRLFDQDRDNAIKNMVTCVIEERLAFPIYRAESVVKGTFSAAITDLTS